MKQISANCRPSPETRHIKADAAEYRRVLQLWFYPNIDQTRNAIPLMLFALDQSGRMTHSLRVHSIEELCQLCGDACGSALDSALDHFIAACMHSELWDLPATNGTSYEPPALCELRPVNFVGFAALAPGEVYCEDFGSCYVPSPTEELEEIAKTLRARTSGILKRCTPDYVSVGDQFEWSTAKPMEPHSGRAL